MPNWEDDARVVPPDNDAGGQPVPRIPGRTRPRDGAPIEVEQVELYRVPEADIFNEILQTAPYAYKDVTSGDGAAIGTQTPRAAAWGALHMYGIIAEDRRPKLWLDIATAKLRSLADYLLTVQAGSPTELSSISSLIGPTASADTEYGGFCLIDPTDSSHLAVIYSEDVAAGGLALLRAYQVLGDRKYAVGYHAALTCLRRMQCGGKLTNYFAATDAAGTLPYNSGMWTHSMSISDPFGIGVGTDCGGPVTGNVTMSLGTSSGMGNWGAAESNDQYYGFFVAFGSLPGTQCRFAVATKPNSALGTLTMYVRLAGNIVTTLTSTGVSTWVSATGGWVTKPTSAATVIVSAISDNGALTSGAAGSLLMELR